MKNTAILFLSIISISCPLFAQQSDFQTVLEFKEDISKFKHQIAAAITSQQLENINFEIDEFENYYSESEELINRALYPQSFDTEIEALESSLITNENRLVMIEHQREQLFDMSDQITSQRSEINRLYTMMESMKLEILTSQASEAHLSELITNYREHIEYRDKLIFQMIDSLLITHENISFLNSNEGESQSYSITNSQNPLYWIETLLEENIQQLTQQNRLWNVEDYIRMYSLQQHFEDVWNKVGEDLISVYGGEHKNEIARSIDKANSDWSVTSTKGMWTAIDQYLDIHKIDLATFDSRDSFFTSMEAHIQNGMRLSENEILTANGFSEFKKVAEFWRSTFKNEWNLTTNEARLLTSDEINVIDVALNQWEETSRPIHPMLVAILSIMLVSITGFILVMVRSKASR